MTEARSRREFESLAQASERTGLCTKTLRRRIAAGELTAYRAGPRIIRLDPRDVDHLMVQIPTMGGATQSSPEHRR